MRNYPTNIQVFNKEDGTILVMAETKYAGKSVRAFAKCNPEDSFDKTFGQKLALKRLDYKIIKKREKAAAKRLKLAQETIRFAEDISTRAEKSLTNAMKYKGTIVEEKANLEKELKAMLDERR